MGEGPLELRDLRTAQLGRMAQPGAPFIRVLCE